MADNSDSEIKNRIVYDTGALVQYGLNDLGLLLLMEGLRKRLEKRGGFSEIIPISVHDEYKKFFDAGVVNDEGLPKASVLTLEEIHTGTALVSDISEVAINHREESRELWFRTSRKAQPGSGVATTDLDLIAYAKLSAEKGHPTYVFTTDDDVIAPLHELESKGSPVHPCLYTKTDEVSSVCRKDMSSLFFLEGALADLYGMEPTFSAYMLSRQFQIGDVRSDVVWKIRNSLGTKKLDDGAFKRYPLAVVELTDVENLKDTKYKIPDDHFRRNYKENRTGFLQRCNLLDKMYREWKLFVAVRNRKMGLLVLMSFGGGRNTRGKHITMEPKGVQWRLLPTHYLTGYQLDWYIPISRYQLNYKE